MNQGLEQENLWGYAKRLSFVSRGHNRALSQRKPESLSVLDVGCGNGTLPGNPPGAKRLRPANMKV